jgi:hypothetical protein
MLHAACCILHVACCILHVACCILHVACCILHVACCMLHVARCMFCATCVRLRGECCTRCTCRPVRAPCFPVRASDMPSCRVQITAVQRLNNGQTPAKYRLLVTIAALRPATYRPVTASRVYIQRHSNGCIGDGARGALYSTRKLSTHFEATASPCVSHARLPFTLLCVRPRCCW